MSRWDKPSTLATVVYWALIVAIVVAVIVLDTLMPVTCR